MDIVSHGLWGGVAFGRKNRKDFLTAFFWGIFPDLFSFGPYFVLMALGLVNHPSFGEGHPPPDAIPSFVHALYNFSHSILIFAAIFVLVSIIARRPAWLLAPWGLHIVFDIFTHSYGFFPTPFLWPVFSFKVNGIPWSEPIIFLPNLAILAVLYAAFFVVRRRQRPLSDAVPRGKTE